ncbi:MAG: choice-of-anchor Q domain-containing protein [bacterium]
MSASSTASATLYEVHATADDADQGANGNCTLREAVLAANSNAAVDACAAGSPGEDTIVLDAASYALTIVGSAEDSAATGDLDVREDLRLAGRGAAMTTITAAGSGDRVLQVASNATVHIQDLTITGGSLVGAPSEPVAGGGLRNDGDLTLVRVVVTGNEARGGGVRDGGSGTGGGIFNSATGTLILDGARVSNNRAKGGDGAAYCCTDENPCHCFRVGNGGAAEAGALYSEGEVTVLRSLLVENEAVGGNGAEYLGVDWGIPGDASGGAVALAGGTATVADSVIRENRASAGSGEPGAAAWRGALGSRRHGDDRAHADRRDNARSAATGSRHGAARWWRGERRRYLRRERRDRRARQRHAGRERRWVATATTARCPSDAGRRQRGGLQANGRAVAHATFADNVVVSGTSEVAGAVRGGNVDSNGTTTLANSILAASYAIAPPAAPVLSVCDGTVPLASLGGNVESPIASCGLAAAHDQSAVSVAALALEPLALAGGLSETRALGAGSVAIDAGVAASCSTRDQRNYVRNAGACDAGAFEANAAPCTDGDRDGFAAEGGVCGAADCNDANPNVNPGAIEIPGNGVDDDCTASTPGCLTPELAEAGSGGSRARGAWMPPFGAALALFAALRLLRRGTRRRAAL